MQKVYAATELQSILDILDRAMGALTELDESETGEQAYSEIESAIDFIDEAMTQLELARLDIVNEEREQQRGERE